MKCPDCKTEMKPLFSSQYCPNDCDKKVKDKSKSGIFEEIGIYFPRKKIHYFNVSDIKVECIKPLCNLPPKGWECRLQQGHDGPCPTYMSPTPLTWSYATLRVNSDEYLRGLINSWREVKFTWKIAWQQGEIDNKKEK